MKTSSATVIVGAGLLNCCAALAALGGDVASIEADRAHMKAQRRIFSIQKFSVQEIRTSYGTTVREYVSPTGKVFAVVWEGAHMPDLQQLFGDYFAAYQDAAKASRKGRGPLSIEQSDLVVYSGGRMRGFAGRAYVPQLVPLDVSLDEIK